MQTRIDTGRRLVAATIVLATTAVTSISLTSVSYAAPQSDGALRIVVSGLPPGQPGLATLRGPRIGHRTLRGTVVKVGSLTPGRYRLTPKKVQILKAKGDIRKGATAQPVSSAVTVRVIPGKTQVAHVDYGSIINPGVVSLPKHGTHAVGPKGNPRAVVVTHGAGFHVGLIVTAGPTTALPSGLVSSITAIKSGPRSDTLYLDPVAVTYAVPVINTGGVTPVADQAQTSALLGLKVEQDIAHDCGLSGQAKLNPIVRLDGMNVDADISANPWGGGPKANLVVSSNWTFGFKLNTIGAINCKREIAAPEVPFAIPVGPVVIPAYVALPVSAKISLSGETKTQVTYSWKSEVGMRTHRAGPLLIPTPVFTVSHPSASLSISTTPKISVEGDVDLEAGLGARNVADLSFKAGTSLEAVLEPASCHLDWKLGNLSAGGKVGPFSIGTPDFTAFTHRIWTGCRSGSSAGSGGGSPPTSPTSPTSTPPSAGTFTQLSAGGYHTCGLRPDGTAVCWGYKDVGDTAQPSGTFTQLSAGYFHACGLRGEGAAVCWGNNYQDAATPPSGTFTQLAAGFEDTCGLRSDGTPVCWGFGEWGQSTPPDGTFTQLSGGGEFFTCGLRTDGTAACWGYNGKGQTTPPGGIFTQLTAGYEHACGLRSNGIAVCWGDNSYGQSTPPDGSFTQLTAGMFHTCGLRSNGIAICWGNNQFGQSAPPSGSSL